MALLATTMPAYAGTPQEVVAQDTAEAAPPATDPVAAALAEAKSSGKPVEVPSLTTQFSETTANTDGASFTSDMTPSPTRILVDGTWTDLDMSLAKTGGSVAPKVAGNSVSFAAGGSAAALASVSIPKDSLKSAAASMVSPDVSADVGRSTAADDPGVSLGWPTGQAPTPVVSGETARYAAIAPGVDAVVQANPRGFDLDLQVPAKLDAPATIALPLTFAGGVKVKDIAATKAAIPVLSAAGDPVGLIGPFTMSDSSVDPKSGEPSLVKPVPVSVASVGGKQVLQVPIEMFTQPDAVLPLKVSATIPIALNSWGRGWKGTNPADADFRVGVLNDATRARGYVSFPVGQRGAGTVTSASLSVWKDWTGSCSNKLEVVAMGAAWKPDVNNGFPGPTNGAVLATKEVPCPQTKLEEIKVGIPANVVQGWASGGTNHGFGFRTPDDTGSSPKIEWFRLCSPAECTGGSKKDNVPSLSVTYAAPQALTPTNLNLDPPLVNNMTTREQPTLQAAFPITPSPQMQQYPAWGRFRVFKMNGAQDGPIVCEMRVAVGGPGNTNAPMTSCPGGTKLENAQHYRFDAFGETAYGVVGTSGASFGPFLVDLVRPGPPLISATAVNAASGAAMTVPGDGWATTADPNKPVTFTVTPNPADTDTAAIQIKQDQVALADVPSDGKKPFTVAWTPGPGWHVFQASVVDKAGLVSYSSQFKFGIGPPSMTAPGIEARSAQFFPIAAVANAPAGVSALKAQVLWKAPGDKDYAVINDGLKVGGDKWDGNAVIDAATRTLRLPAGLTLDISKPAASHNPAIQAPAVVALMVRFLNPSGQPAQLDTAPVKVEWVSHAFGGNFAVDDIGPGQVALSTGELSIQATDATLPGSGGVSLGRSWLSYEASNTDSLFGPGWVPSIPLPDDGAGDAQIAFGPDNSSLTLTYPDGWVDTYAPGTVPGLPAKSVPNGAVTFVGSGDTAQEGGYLLLNGGTLTFTQPSGSATTWTYGSNLKWTVQTVSSTSAGDSTRTFTTLPTDSADGFIATVTGQYISNPGQPVTNCASLTLLEVIKARPGCRILTAAITKKTGNIPSGAFAGRISSASIRVWDGGAGAAAKATDIRVADYTYTAQGLLATVVDPRLPDLVTRYDYNKSKIDSPAGGGDKGDGVISAWQLTTLTPASAAGALKPFKFTYDKDLGRLLQVSREQPNGGPDANTFIVYGVPVDGNGVDLPNLTPGEVTKWDQPTTGAPQQAVAVFDPDPADPGMSPPVNTDKADHRWVLANLTYLNGQGATVNTAVVGDNQWLIDTTEYTYARVGGGQVTQTLSAANRAIALQSRDGCLKAGGPDVVCRQADTASRAIGLTSFTVYDPNNPGVVTDTYGPIAMTTDQPSTVDTRPARTHVRTVYNEGVPANLKTEFSAAGTFLPTTTTTSGWSATTSITPPTTPSGSAGTDARTTRTGYDKAMDVTGSVAGWSQRAATSTTTTGNDITAITNASAINAAGETLATKQPMSDGKDAGTTLSYAYTVESSAAGVPSECVNRPGWDGLTCVTKPAAQPSGATLPTSTVVEYSQLLAPVHTNQVSGSSKRTTVQTYDSAGRPVTTTVDGDAAAGKSITPTTVAYSPTLGLPVSVSRPGTSVKTGYDSWGRVTSTTDASGNTGTVSYNIASQPRVSSDGLAPTEYDYDSPRAGDRLGEHRGVVTRQVESLGAGVPDAWTAAYGPTGGPKTVTAPNGVTDSRTYSTTGALLSKVYTASTGAALMAGWTQTYNVHGQVVGETGPVGVGEKYSSRFDFDGAGRLIRDRFERASANPVTRAYQLNPNSDRTNQTITGIGGGQARAGTFNAADQLQTTTITGGGAGSGSYVYDPYGRTTTLPSVDATSGAAVTYGWKINDRVDTETMTVGTGPAKATVLDDPTDRRMSATTTGSVSETTTYLYGDASDSPASLSVAKSGGVKTSSRFTDSPAGGMSISQETVASNGSAIPPSWFTLPSAASGSVTSTVNVQLSNPHGDVVATIPNTANAPASAVSTVTAWAPFGTEQTGGVPAKTYGWEGTAQRDTVNASSLITMGARIYNQTTGRFLTVDPVPGGNANPYMYPADPVNGEDLSGQWALFEAISNAWASTTTYVTSYYSTSRYSLGRSVWNFGYRSFTGLRNWYGVQSRWAVSGYYGARHIGHQLFSKRRGREKVNEHTKGARPSTEQKHQKGQSRKGRDRPGGEKGDKRRPYQR
ncbi:MAG: RHS repeat-associated core domain-containing protein [Candidatus Nanopelagicales bacterium]